MAHRKTVSFEYFDDLALNVPEQFELVWPEQCPVKLTIA